VINGIRYAGATVVTLDWTIWAQALGHGTSAQKAELIVLTQGLKYGKDKVINVYTDSWYAFAMAHVHGALCRERGFLTSESKNIKIAQKILALLEALWLPKRWPSFTSGVTKRGPPQGKGKPSS
jgi:ribonuclease HI